MVHGNADKMHAITKTCALFLWMYLLTLVHSKDCALEEFLNGPSYDSNFDITGLDANYPGGKQVRVGCNVGYTGFFKLICVEGKWQTRGNKCQPKSCGHPGDAQFADFNLQEGDDFVFGSKVVYTCHKGYQMVSRTNFRRCMAEGWDGVVPVCEAQQCPAIHVENNVQVIGDPEDANYGNVVRFRCKSSSEVLEGSAELYCDENGEWSGTSPKCTEIKCTAPVIENGFVPGDIQEYKEHEVLNFQCNPQYKRTEDRQSKCIKVGSKAEWSPTPACEEIKCDLKLPALEGTRYEPAARSVFSPGDTLRVLCGDKHWIVNHQTTSAETTCQSDGKWSIRPLCQEVICSDRDPNVYRWGIYWNEQKKLGDSVSYTCRYDFQNTASQATCTRDGWAPKPLCRGIYCTKTNIENAEITYNNKNRYTPREQVQYTCRNGNRNTFTITCTQSGWTGKKSCSECPQAVVPNGFVVGPYQDKMYYTCNEGYKLFTKGWWGEAKCIGGVWSGLNQCIDNRLCGQPPVIPNGKVSSAPGSRAGQITCNDGYIQNQNQLRCHDGKWYPTGSSLETICTPKGNHCSPPPKIENTVVLNSYQKEYLSNSEVTYQCRENFIMEGDDTIRCKDGRWEKINITCIPYCDKLNNEKQSMNFTSDKDIYMNGDVIEYQCIVSDAAAEYNATCFDGKWIKPVECKACSKLPHVPFAYVSDKTKKAEYQEGDVIHFTCEMGYISGPTIKYMCSAGDWLAVRRGSCYLKPCPLPEDTLYGSYQITEGDDLVFGTTIQYVCYKGYQVVGKDTLTCMLDGWSDKAPTCELITCKVDIMHSGLTATGLPSATQTVQAGHKLQFDCSSEYQLDGSEEIECLETGQWSAPFPTCSEKCVVSNVPANLRITQGLSGRYLTKGQKLTFGCQRRGHFIQGNATVECLASGEWSSPFPTCGAPMGCSSKPPPLADGDTKASVQFRYIHNAKVEYICQNYYIMEGEPFMTCNNGEWTGQMRCLKPCTVDKDAMRRHNIRFGYSYRDKLYSAHNDVITFACTHGTRHDGILEMVQKCIDGEMNLPTCQ